MELLSIVESEEDQSYSAALVKHFDSMGYTMVSISEPAAKAY
jgi:hypothetical protein